jgi:hypothetical protein
MSRMPGHALVLASAAPLEKMLDWRVAGSRSLMMESVEELKEGMKPDSWLITVVVKIIVQRWITISLVGGQARNGSQGP